MKVTSDDEVFELMGAHVYAAALGAAMELGLFWRLAEQALDAAGVAQALGIPIRRCQYWLQLLTSLGLVEQGPGGYAPTSTAQVAILEAASQNTWALLAQEARERFPAVRDLAMHIHRPGSTWEPQGLTPPRFLGGMKESPERARRFTRMLYEIHQPLAVELAESLDMSGVERLMDLGGGSGVISLTLLRRHPELSAVVVDIANVCVVGQEIAAEETMEDRISFHAADFLDDELPSGFGMVLECDVGEFREALFRKVRAAMKPGGRFVIVEKLATMEGVAPSSRLSDAFLSSLANPDYAIPTVAEIQAMLTDAGFEPVSEQTLSSGQVVIEARR